MGVALVVGISEEIFWRGVALSLLTELIGNPWMAAAIAAVAFGVAHAAQGKDGIAIATVMAMVLSALVIWAGGLYMAIAMHVIYDIVAGFDYGRMQKTENG
jgi:membrane protease YdiL (CAAX protease family)